VRKKIPTITRSDPVYAAALRQDRRQILGREKDEGAAPLTEPERSVQVEVHRQEAEIEQVGPTKDAQGATDPANPSARPHPLAYPKHPTRKIDIRVNALARQEADLRACGVDPAHVVRAALRRAVKAWDLAPAFAPPSEAQRTRNTQWQARTSLAVDAANLGALLRDHDPLDVLSKWALIRGQLEPRIWAEIDTLLAEIADRAAAPQAIPDDQKSYPKR
jgi:hypothetical protein